MGATFQFPSSSDYKELLQRKVLGANNRNFASDAIPQTYRNLYALLTLLSDTGSSGALLGLIVNNDLTTTNYKLSSVERLTATWTGFGTVDGILGAQMWQVDSNASPYKEASPSELWIYGYSSTTEPKRMKGHGSSQRVAAGAMRETLSVCDYIVNTAVSLLSFDAGIGGLFLAGSAIEIYGYGKL